MKQKLEVDGGDLKLEFYSVLPTVEFNANKNIWRHFMRPWPIQNLIVR